MPCALGTRTPKYSILARTRESASDFSSRNTAAFVHDGERSVAVRGLERVVGIDEDCDRTFIDQLHGHYGLENSRCDVYTKFSELLAKFFIQSLGQLQWGGGNETRPTLPPRVSVESKL